MSSLGNIFNLIGGGTPSTKEETYWGKGTPWISSADISLDGKIIPRRSVTPRGIKYSTTNIVPKGTVIVVTRVGLGKVAKLQENTCFSQDIQALIPKDNSLSYSAQFLMLQLLYKMQSMKFQGQGTTISGITKKQLADIHLFLPTLPEQERIVAHIEELFSELDSGMETLKKTKAQLDVYRQAVLKEAFEGEYKYVPLKNIATTISGYAFKSNRYVSDGQYVVVKIGNVKQYHFDFSRDLTKTNEVNDAILKKYLLQYGDCLITLTGSRGKRDYGFVAMITSQENYLLNQRIAALRFDTRIALPEFYQYYLSSPEYRNAFFGYETGNVGQGNVGIKALQEPMVICPSIEEQRKISENIETSLSVCNNIEQTIDAALEQANALRHSILKEAFEGRTP